MNSKNHKCINIKLFYYILFLLIININEINALGDSTSIYDLDINQLSKFQIATPSKVTQSIIEIPSTIKIITSTEIKENGYFTLEQALSTLPGLQFRNVQGINSYIFMRGIPNQNNLILLLIDGVQVNELNSGGFYGGGQYNLSNVERIEIVYGPSSVAYGTNAVSGIINIITKNPLNKKLNINVLKGNFNTLSADFGYSYINKDTSFGIIFSGMYKQSDKADLRGNAGDNNWSDNMENYEKDFSFDLKINKDKFIFGANYLHKQTPTTTQEKSIGTIYQDFGTFWNIRFINTYLKYKNDFSENISFISTLYNRNATVLDNTIYQILNNAQVGYYRPNNLIGIENIIDYKYSKQFSITSGLTFEYEKLAESPTLTYSSSPNVSPPTPSTPNMLTNTLASIFVEPRIILYNNLYLSGGVRFDNSSVYDQVLTPRIGLSYSYQKYVFRLSYSEAFRAPKPWDYTDGIGNSNLKPEKINSLEGSVNIKLSDYINSSVTLYKNDLKNSLFREITPNGARWVNRNEINTFGTELTLNYSTKEFKSFLNYTFTQSENETGIFIPEISKHTANFGITYYFIENFSLNLRANYIGERKNPKIITATNNDIIEPALILHSTVTLLNYFGFDFQFSAYNLLDKEYFHSSNRTPDRYRQSQRTFLFIVGYNFNNL